MFQRKQRYGYRENLREKINFPKKNTVMHEIKSLHETSSTNLTYTLDGENFFAPDLFLFERVK